MKHFFIVFFILSYTLYFTQNDKEYDSIFNKTFLESTKKNYQQAIKTADSLYQASETPMFQSRSLLLAANINHQAGNTQKSVDLAVRASNLMKSTDDYFTQCQILGFISSLYAELKLYKEAKSYSDECIRAAKKITDKSISNEMQAVIYLSRGDIELSLKRYENAILFLKKAQSLFSSLKNPRPFHTSGNERLLGAAYYHLKKPNESLKHYQKALKIAEAIPESYANGLIYSGLTLVYIDLKDHKNAEKYLNLAQKVANKCDFLSLKKEVNDTAEKYYLFEKDYKNLSKIQIEKNAVAEKIEKQKSLFIDHSLGQLKKDKSVAEEKINSKNKIITGGVLLLLILLLYLIDQRSRHKKNFASYTRVIDDLHRMVKNQDDAIVSLSEPAKLGNAKAAKKSENVMIDETQKKLLRKLDQFENSTLFLKNSVSLSTLSSYCETNSRYLSNIINLHKKKDFNNYINGLRIKYIIQKLEADPKYRKYKIAALASETGFSSPNKFSSVFKKETNISPSIFIKFLNESAEEEV